MIAISKNKRSQIILREGSGGVRPADVYLSLEIELEDTLLCEIEPPLDITLCEQD